MITPSDVITRFPEFANVSNDTIEFCIEIGCLILGQCAYPSFINNLLLYATAHCIKKTLETRVGNWTSMGPLTDFQIGQLMGKYGATQASKSLFVENMSATKYGQQYLELVEAMKLNNYPLSILG